MSDESPDYTLFSKFIETYAPVGFQGICPQDTLMPELVYDLIIRGLLQPPQPVFTAT